MTLAEALYAETGYKCQTDICLDYAVAEKFGAFAIEDTFNKAFEKYKDNYKHLTELVIVTNWKIWQWYGVNEEYARLYNDLWTKSVDYAVENLKGEELSYYYQTTD